MWITLRDLVLGIDRDPKVVAAVRAVLLLGVPWAIEAGVAQISGYGVAHPAFVGIAGATGLLIRAVGEAALDQLKLSKFGIGNGKDQ